MRNAARMFAGVLAILLSAGLAVPALGAIGCNATGEATPLDDGTFLYQVTVTYDFEQFASPDRFMLSLEHLMGCEFYDPEDPIQQNYVIPHDGTSPAVGECYDVTGMPTDEIVWISGMAMDDPVCWFPYLHMYWANDGPTVECMPEMTGEVVFEFVSYGQPLPSAMYYGALLIYVGDTCIECDYEGPMPDCNMWAPIEETRWGMIKSLYR